MYSLIYGDMFMLTLQTFQTFKPLSMRVCAVTALKRQTLQALQTAAKHEVDAQVAALAADWLVRPSVHRDTSEHWRRGLIKCSSSPIYPRAAQYCLPPVPSPPFLPVMSVNPRETSLINEEATQK